MKIRIIKKKFISLEIFTLIQKSEYGGGGDDLNLKMKIENKLKAY